MAYRTSKLIRHLTLILFGIIILSGCYYDNVEELYPVASVCDTANVTYSGTVKPIIDDNCVTCHSGQAPSGGVRLETYDQASAAAAIAPGTYGSLYGTISHAEGNVPMPQGGKLSDCNIAKVNAWINAGAPNN